MDCRVSEIFRVFALPPLAFKTSTCSIVPSPGLYMPGMCMCEWAQLHLGDRDKGLHHARVRTHERA